MPTAPPTRYAVLVLVTASGAVLGRLPALPVATPWWQDARPVVGAVRDAFGLDVVVLRMLDSELPRPHGGRVTYLAEVQSPPALPVGLLEPWDRPLDDDAWRPPYARPGGPSADLRWADEALARRGLARRGPAVQDRTWNLSALWELPLDGGGSAWLKVVPPFFAHEGAVLDLLGDAQVPGVLAHEGTRLLLAGVAGDDRYGAPLPELREMTALLVGLQVAWAGRTHELLAAGVPDSRADALAAAVADVAGRRGSALAAAERAALDGLVDGLPGRLAAVAACGLPDTLVHGDFHPGNVRGTAGALTLLDWADSTVGHPLLDLPPFLGAIDVDDAPLVREHWLARWRAAVPGSDPARAADLLAPVSAARLAVVYQRFVDHIEPVERRHHDADVVDALRTAARLTTG